MPTSTEPKLLGEGSVDTSLSAITQRVAEFAPAVHKVILIGLRDAILSYSGEHGHPLNSGGRRPAENLREQFLRLEPILKAKTEGASVTRQELLRTLRDHVGQALGQREGRQLRDEIDACFQEVNDFLYRLAEIPLEELDALKLSGLDVEEVDKLVASNHTTHEGDGIDTLLTSLALEAVLQQFTLEERLAYAVMLAEVKNDSEIDDDDHLAIKAWADIPQAAQKRYTARVIRQLRAGLLEKHEK